MTTLKSKIERKELELERLRTQLQESFESVREHWNSNYHNSFTDKCEMIYLLMQGKKYQPYSFSKEYKIERAQMWRTKELLDYCNIYQGFGNPIGFIALENALFDATSGKHKNMWFSAIKSKKEERSFEEFGNQLKTDLEFLKQSFENAVKESGSGAYSTDSYLIEYEEKELETGKYYIYLENTTRRL
jgi:hypothetical protein